MQNYVVKLDVGIFGEQELWVNYTHTAGNPPKLVIHSVYWNKYDIEIPEDVWCNPAFLDVILDTLSAVHSEDYRDQ